MYIDITKDLELPKELRPKERAEIRLIFQAVEIRGDRKQDFGLMIGFFHPDRLPVSFYLDVSINDLPCFHQEDFELMRDFLRERQIGTFAAILGASAAWYARNLIFKLVREKNEETYFRIIARHRGNPENWGKTEVGQLVDLAPFIAEVVDA